MPERIGFVPADIQKHLKNHADNGVLPTDGYPSGVTQRPAPLEHLPHYDSALRINDVLARRQVVLGKLPDLALSEHEEVRDAMAERMDLFLANPEKSSQI